MKTSASGRALIEQREGRRLTAYRDTKGILTIGVGHTGRMSPPPVHAGMTITETECDVFLATDLAPVEAVIAAALSVPVSQNEFDALASLGFNIGAAGLKRSRAMRCLNVGDVSGAAAAFMDWCKPASLSSRRQQEKAQFLEPDGVNAAGVSRSHNVAIQRAQVLATRAATKRGKARTHGRGGSAVALAGGAASVATAVGHHGHLAWIICGVAIVGAAIDGLVAITHQAQAATLAANASKQAVAAATLTKAAAAAPAPATKLAPAT